jgi:transcriptional regulator
MYIPDEFKINDPEEIEQFLLQNPFGILISNGSGLEPMATHIPFMIRRVDRDFILEAHLSNSNKQADLLRKGKNVMVIFQGPHAYVSASVYEKENVSTWNYQAVHLYGTLNVLNPSETDMHLNELLANFEGQRPNGLNYNTLSKEMLSQYKNEIIAFRVKTYRTEAAYKLSQNRSQTDQKNIVIDLSQQASNSKLIDEMNRINKRK